MKLKLTLLLFFFAGLSVMAGPSSLFNVDQQKIQEEMSTLQTLENQVVENDLTYADVVSDHPEYIAGLDLDLNVEGLAASGELPAGIPAFLWGFCLSWVGVIIVYVMTDDNEETKKALYGAIASAIIWGAVWLIVLIA